MQPYCLKPEVIRENETRSLCSVRLKVQLWVIRLDLISFVFLYLIFAFSLCSFSPWNPAVHEEAKEKMFAHKVSVWRSPDCSSRPSKSWLLPDIWCMPHFKSVACVCVCNTISAHISCCLFIRTCGLVKMWIIVKIWITASVFVTNGLLLLFQRRPDDYNKGLPVSGLSWVKPGSTQPFSKEDNPLQTWTFSASVCPPGGALCHCGCAEPHV